MFFVSFIDSVKNKVTMSCKTLVQCKTHKNDFFFNILLDIKQYHYLLLIKFV